MADELSRTQTLNDEQIKETLAAASEQEKQDARLRLVNQFAEEVARNFEECDKTDNGFLGKHELMALSADASQSQLARDQFGYLSQNFRMIRGLHKDDQYLPKASTWVKYDHLGLSPTDISELDLLTSNLDSDRWRWARTHALGHPLAGFGTVGAGIVGFFGAVAGGCLVGARAGLIVGGAGAAVAGLSYLAGTIEAKGRAERLRSAIKSDSGLDRQIVLHNKL